MRQHKAQESLLLAAVRGADHGLGALGAFLTGDVMGAATRGGVLLERSRMDHAGTDSYIAESIDDDEGASAAIGGVVVNADGLFDTDAAQADLVAYNAVADDLVAREPVFDENSGEFDEVVFAELKQVCASLERGGAAAPDALKRAAKYVLGRNPWATGLKRDDKKPESRKTDVKKNIDAERRQPAKVSEAPADKPRNRDISQLIRSGELDKMSDAELDKMEKEGFGEKTKKRSAG